MESSRSGWVLECGGILVSGTDVDGTEEDEKCLIAPHIPTRGNFVPRSKNVRAVNIVLTCSSVRLEGGSGVLLANLTAFCFNASGF